MHVIFIPGIKPVGLGDYTYIYAHLAWGAKRLILASGNVVNKDIRSLGYRSPFLDATLALIQPPPPQHNSTTNPGFVILFFS